MSKTCRILPRIRIDRSRMLFRIRQNPIDNPDPQTPINIKLLFCRVALIFGFVTMMSGVIGVPLGMFLSTKLKVGHHITSHGAGSADSCLWRVDPDPAIFVIDLQNANKKLIIKKSFLLYVLWRYNYINFQREKVKKKPKNSRNQGLSYYFFIMDPDPYLCLADPDPGGPETSGSDGSE